ncbi:MAG: mercuric reductase [Spirochaetales bacterium]|nr:mercuric reductase [Spirochaetales bacterium]
MGKSYDAVLIGTGQATYTIVSELVKRGESVAVAEGDRVGGTCVNYGCTPTKTIVASARAAHMARRGEELGVRVGAVEVDFSRVMARQNAIRNGNSEGLQSYLEKHCDLYYGYASFAGTHSVRVGDEVIEADRIYIHTGSRPRVPAVPGLDTVPYLDNARILDLVHLPDHLIVLGGSYIALEFAQAFRRLGSEVTVLQRSGRLVTREDEDVAHMIREFLEREGVRILCDVEVESVAEGDGGGVEVNIRRRDETSSVAGSHLLLGLGRVPNSERLNLDAAGVRTDEGGFIPVNDELQTNVPHIYAVGDINGRGAFTHTSVNDGEIIVHNLRGESWKVTDRHPTYALFTDPPLGRVGMNEITARRSGRKVLMATMPMSRVARAREKGETDGIIKMIVDAETDRILGATVLGVGGDEVIAMMSAWMYSDLPCRRYRRSVLPHPTVAELVPWVLDGLEPLE